MIRHIRNASFVVLMIVLGLARTVNANGCSPWNSSIMGATGTCSTCWEGYQACQENCSYWGGQQNGTGMSENFQCQERVEGGADVSCSCYYVIPD